MGPFKNYIPLGGEGYGRRGGGGRDVLPSVGYESNVKKTLLKGDSN